jgi:hypothetical protein
MNDGCCLFGFVNKFIIYMNSINDELLQFTDVYKYIIKEVLCYGDLGSVHKAWSLKDHQWVAIKVSTGEQNR